MSQVQCGPLSPPGCLSVPCKMSHTSLVIVQLHPHCWALQPCCDITFLAAVSGSHSLKGCIPVWNPVEREGRGGWLMISCGQSCVAWLSIRVERTDRFKWRGKKAAVVLASWISWGQWSSPWKLGASSKHCPAEHDSLAPMQRHSGTWVAALHRQIWFLLLFFKASSFKLPMNRM